MCGPSTAIGVATGAFQGMSAIGNFQSGRAQTDATNRARLNAFNDQVTFNRLAYNKEVQLYNKTVEDYKAGLEESERALSKAITDIHKQAAERRAAVDFAGEQNLIQDIQAQGQIAGMQPGGDRDRMLAMVKGLSGRRTAGASDMLLRARFLKDIRGAERLTDEANAYRRKLFSGVPLAPTEAMRPSAPIMQSGPSALSLVGGLGSAALGGLTAGMGAESFFKENKMFGKGG